MELIIIIAIFAFVTRAIKEKKRQEEEAKKKTARRNIERREFDEEVLVDTRFPVGPSVAPRVAPSVAPRVDRQQGQKASSLGEYMQKLEAHARRAQELVKKHDELVLKKRRGDTEAFEREANEPLRETVAARLTPEPHKKVGTTLAASDYCAVEHDDETANAYNQTRSRNTSGILSFGGTELERAIIMSEILSKPKALRR